MALSLTSGQQDCLAAIQAGDDEPLYLVEIDVGPTQEFTINGSATGLLRLETDDGNSLEVTFSVTVPTAANVADMTGTDAERAAAVVEATILAVEAGSVVGDWSAWALGNTLVIRADGAADTEITIDSAPSNVSAVGSSTPASYAFVSGPVDLPGLPASVVGVGSAGQEKAVLERTASRSEREVIFRWDREVEAMVTTAPLIGRTVTIRRGLPGFATASWIPSGVYAIADGPFVDALGTLRTDRPTADSYRPDERPMVRLVLRDRIEWYLEGQSGKATSAEARPLLLPRHPLLSIRDTIRQMLLGDRTVSASEFVDEGSLDPTDPAYAEISHLMCHAADRRDYIVESYTTELSTVVGPVRIFSGDIYQLISDEIRRVPDLGATDAPQYWRAYSESSGFGEGEEVDLSQVLDDLVLLVPQGQLLAEEDGKMRLRRIDYRTIAAGTATIRDWTDEFQPEALSDMRREFFTRIVLGVGNALSESDLRDFWRRTFEMRETASASAHRLRGIPALGREFALDLRFQQSVGFLRFGVPGGTVLTMEGSGSSQCSPLLAADTGLEVSRSLGMAGSYVDPSTTIQDISGGTAAIPSWAQLSSTRRAYLRLETGPNLYAVDGTDIASDPRPSQVEVIECDGAVIAGEPTLPTMWNPAVAAAVSIYQPTAPGAVPNRIRFSVSERGFGGTDTPAIWLPGCPVADVTIARLIAPEWLDRFGWGYPTIRGSTRLGQLDVQIGDFVSVPLPHLIDYRGIGATDLGLVFEVLGKEEREERIDWVLGLASREQPYTPIRVEPPPLVLRPIPPEVVLVDLIPLAGGNALGDGTAHGRPITFAELIAEWDSAGSDDSPTIAGSLPAGADRLLVVVIATYDAGGAPGTGVAVDFGTVAMTLAGSTQDGDVNLEVWTMAEADLATTTTTDLEITGPLGDHHVWAGVYQYADRAVLTTVSGAGTSTEITADSPSPEGSALVSVTVVADTGTTPTAASGALEDTRAVGAGAQSARISATLSGYTTATEATIDGASEQVTTGVLVEAISAVWFDQAGFAWGWDFSQGIASIDLPPYWGTSDLVVDSGSYAMSAATGSIARGAIGASRLGGALSQGTASFAEVAGFGVGVGQAYRWRLGFEGLFNDGRLLRHGGLSPRNFLDIQLRTGGRVQVLYSVSGTTAATITFSSVSTGWHLLDVVLDVDPATGRARLRAMLDGAEQVVVAASAEHEGLDTGVDVASLVSPWGGDLLLVAGGPGRMSLASHRYAAAAAALYTP